MFSFIIIIFEFLFMHARSLGAEKCPAWISGMCIFCFTLGFYYDVTHSKKLHAIQNPLVYGYTFRVCLLFFDLYGRNIYNLPNSGADSEWFYDIGRNIAHGTGKGNGFYALTGLGIKLFGDARLFLQFCVMLFSIITIIMVDKSLQLLDVDVKRRRKVAYFLALLPNFAILSSIFLRESVVGMFVAFSVYFFIKWWKGTGEYNYWLAFAACFAGAYFHSGAVSVAAGLVIARLLCDRNTNKLKITAKSLFAAVIFVIVFTFLYMNYSQILFGKMEGVDSLEEISNNRIAGGSSYASYAGNSDSITNLIIYTPIRMIMFQFSPFFWQIRGLSDIIAMVFDSFFFIYVYYRTIKSIKDKKNTNRILIIALFITALATAFVFGWGVSNTGTALRHRSKMMAIFAVLLGLTSTSSNPFEDRQRTRLRRL